MQRLVIIPPSSVLFAPVPSLAQIVERDRETTVPPKATFPVGTCTLVDDDGRMIDAARRTIVLKHGPLDASGTGPTTMEAEATEPKMLVDAMQADNWKCVPAGGTNARSLAIGIEVVGNRVSPSARPAFRRLARAGWVLVRGWNRDGTWTS